MNRLQKSFDVIFILSDKVVFMSSVLLCVQLLPGKPLFLPLQKCILLEENEPVFRSMFLLGLLDYGKNHNRGGGGG